jgi:transcriptional regulator GlxA family with amidase domain
MSALPMAPRPIGTIWSAIPPVNSIIARDWSYKIIARQSLTAPVHDSIELAAHEIMRNDGRCRIDFLAHHTGLSIRNFQKMFRENVGVSPKLYSRIVRFEAALRTKAASPHMSWMTIA